MFHLCFSAVISASGQWEDCQFDLWLHWNSLHFDQVYFPEYLPIWPRGRSGTIQRYLVFIVRSFPLISSCQISKTCLTKWRIIGGMHSTLKMKVAWKDFFLLQVCILFVAQAVFAECQCCLSHLPLMISPTLLSKGKVTLKTVHCESVTKRIFSHTQPPLFSHPRLVKVDCNASWFCLLACSS